MHFHLVTHSSKDWCFMAFRAGISIEQWAEACFGSENALENLLPLLEPGVLFWSETRKRLPKRRLLR